MGVAKLTLNNSKSEGEQGSYQDETQVCSRQSEFESSNVIFYKFCSEGGVALKVVCEIV